MKWIRRLSTVLLIVACSDDSAPPSDGGANDAGDVSVALDLDAAVDAPVDAVGAGSSDAGVDALGMADATLDVPLDMLDVDASVPLPEGFTVGWEVADSHPQSALIGAYNRSYNQQRDSDALPGEWYANTSNEEAVLANNHPAVMLSLLVMFEATGELDYLHAFVRHGDAVLAHRDDATGFVDFRGQSNPVWSNRLYNDSATDERAYPWIFESGELSYPLAAFAALVLADTSVQTQRTHGDRLLLDVARAFRRAAAETVAFHHAQWHTQTAFTSPVNGLTYDHALAWYSAAPGSEFTQGLVPGLPLPVNMMVALGSTQAALASAFAVDDPGASASFRERVAALAYYTLVEMEYHTPTDGYRWRYWPRMPYYPAGATMGHDNFEDLSHAAVMTNFAGRCRHYGVGIYGSVELRRFANTVQAMIYGDAEVYRYLDFQQDAASQRYQLGHFLPLAAHAQDRRAFVAEIESVLIGRLAIDQPGNLGGSGGLLGLARLVEAHVILESSE